MTDTNLYMFKDQEQTVQILISWRIKESHKIKRCRFHKLFMVS